MWIYEEKSFGSWDEKLSLQFLNSDNLLLINTHLHNPFHSTISQIINPATSGSKDEDLIEWILETIEFANTKHLRERWLLSQFFYLQKVDSWIRVDEITTNTLNFVDSISHLNHLLAT